MGKIHFSNEEYINWLFDTKNSPKMYIRVALYKQSRLHLGMHTYIHIFYATTINDCYNKFLNKFERVQ